MTLLPNSNGKGVMLPNYDQHWSHFGKNHDEGLSGYELKAKHVLLLLVFCMLIGCVTVRQRYVNLGNPTEYVFSASGERVHNALKKMDGRHFFDYGFFAIQSDGEMRIQVHPHYDPRCWAGPEDEGVEPEEAGKIGRIKCEFKVETIAENGKTRVSVKVIEFRQQVGRTYNVGSEIKKVTVYKEIPSNTYFEYLFLHKLGELLGEMGMPEIKSQ